MGTMNLQGRTLVAAAVTAAALALASCASAGPSGPSVPIQWDSELDLGIPGEVLDTHHDVAFYPACGTEVLNWDGTAYYPYGPSQLDDFPDPTDVVSRASALSTVASANWARMSAPLPTVPMPEPGDDTGTLVIYEGEHAYWESDNGELHTWLTTTELEYSWIC